MLVPRAEFLQLGKRVLQVRWEPKITRETAEKLQPATARREPACGSVPSGPCPGRGETLVPARKVLAVGNMGAGSQDWKTQLPDICGALDDVGTVISKALA